MRDNALPLIESLDDVFQIAGFIIGIERGSFQPCPAAGYADVQFHAELHRFAGLSAHNETDKGLAHADDPIRHPVGAVIVHIDVSEEVIVDTLPTQKSS